MTGRLAHLRAALRLVARGVRARGEPPVTPAVPRRRPAVEHDGIQPDAGRVPAYLAATAGGGIAAFRGGEALPPLFSVTWETAAYVELLASLDPPLPLGGIVHLEGEVVPLRPVRAGERVRCRVELEKAEASTRGVRLTVSSRNWDGCGRLCSQGTAVFLVRAPAPKHAPRPAAREAREVPPTPGSPQAWRDLDRWALRGGDGRRYARVSGDWNPIHLWPVTARPFGFRRPILHGLCIQARVAHALIERLWSGDPGALRRLAVAFRAPVPLPSRARLQAGDGTDGRHWFRLVDEVGEKLLAEGTYAGGRSSSA